MPARSVQDEGRFVRLGAQITNVDHIMSGYFRGECEVVSIALRRPKVEFGEFLVVCKGFADDGTPVVAFHGASGASEALAGAITRIQYGTMKWRLDEYGQK